MTDDTTTTCPACAEEIKAEAVRCKHCSYDLNAPARSKQRRIFWSGMVALAIALFLAFSFAKTWKESGDKAKREIECIELGISPRYCN